MEEDKKKKLIELGPDILSDALLKLAENDDMAERRVLRLTSEPDDVIKSFRSKVNGLKRRKRFIPWRESRKFAAELDRILEDTLILHHV